MTAGLRRRLTPALLTAALILAPILFTFRQIAVGETFTETWQYAYDPVFASAGAIRAQPSKWWGSRWDSTPTVLMATSDRFCARSYRNLEIPLWNPYQALGTPLAAELNVPVLAPLRVLAVYLPGGGDFAGSVGSILYFIIGACGVVLWLRSAQLPLAAAAPAALAYTFTGDAIAAFRFPSYPAAVLMPLVLWRVEELVRKRTPLNALYLGATLALVIVSSHVTLAYVVMLSASLYFLARAVNTASSDGSRAGGRLMLLGGLAAAEGAALSAIAWIPFLEFLRHGFSYKFESSTLPPVLRLTDLVAPGPEVPLGLAAVAVIWGLAGAFVPTRIHLGACALTAFALGQVLGFPVFRLVQHLPGMSAVNPRYALFVGALAACGLMAGAIDAVVRGRRSVLVGAAVATIMVVLTADWVMFTGPPGPRSALLNGESLRTVAALGGVAVLWAGVWMGRRMQGVRVYWGLALAVYGLCAFELLPRAAKEIAPEPRFEFPETEVLRFVRGQTHDGARVVAVSPHREFWPGTSPHLPNVGLVTGLDDPRSVQAVFVRRAYRLLRMMNSGVGHPTVLEFHDYPDILGRGGSPEGPPTGLEMLGVRYLLSRPEHPVPAGHRRIYSDRYVAVDENPRAFPRAFLVHEIVRARGEDDAEQKIRMIDFSRQVVIEGDAPALPDGAPVEAPEGETVVIEQLAPREVRLRAVVLEPGYLILSDTYFPGWSATVDGERARIFPANLALRAVYLEPGEHEVEFRYRPGSFRAGLALCGMGLFALTGCFVFQRRRQSLSG